MSEEPIALIGDPKYRGMIEMKAPVVIRFHSASPPLPALDRACQPLRPTVTGSSTALVVQGTGAVATLLEGNSFANNTVEQTLIRAFAW